MKNELIVRNYHCSEHGYLKAAPKCPKCTTNAYQQGVREGEMSFAEKVCAKFSFINKESLMKYISEESKK